MMCLIDVPLDENDQMSPSQPQLQHFERMAVLGEAAATIAHELTSPLAGIQLRATALKNYIKDERALKELESIRNLTERMSKMILNIGSCARESSTDPLQPVLVENVLRSTHDFVGILLKYSAVEFRLGKLAPGLEIMCREPQIVQVLTNLIRNSMDAIEHQAEKWIALEACPSTHLPDHVDISVTDSGNGISKHIVRRMMSPYFTTKSAGKGTGLGLPIAMSIVKEHNGILYYDHESSHTKFVARLPSRRIQ